MWAECAEQGPLLSAALTFREHTWALIWDTGSPCQGPTLSKERTHCQAAVHVCPQPLADMLGAVGEAISMVPVPEGSLGPWP